MIRFLDVVIAFFCLVLFFPFLVLIALVIKMSSKGPVIFRQQRVGKNNKDFILYKFRTMYADASKQRDITIGNRDSRITKAGYFLRKYKIDELPQLYNVLKNEMSIVGPRPELRKYVNLYTADQRIVLKTKPGITDYASIYFRHENEILAIQPDPEAFYIKQILPVKIRLNIRYAIKRSVSKYFAVIFSTLLSVFK